VCGETYFYYDISHFEQVSKMPFSIRVLLESAIRNCDNFHVNENHVTTILNWVKKIIFAHSNTTKFIYVHILIIRFRFNTKVKMQTIIMNMKYRSNPQE
jgi:aconitase A